jgi:hypothetical protein
LKKEVEESYMRVTSMHFLAFHNNVGEKGSRKKK